MILYHGSNVSIEEIDLSLCKPYKDFGKGFYLTDIKSQADDMASRRVRLSGYGNPSVTRYEFDETLLNDHAMKSHWKSWYLNWSIKDLTDSISSAQNSPSQN